MSDTSYRRRPMVADQNGLAAGWGNSQHEGLHAQLDGNRPVSWHSSSHIPQSHLHLSPQVYPFMRQEMDGSFASQDLPPTPAVYSGYTSPASTFSPLSQPFTDYREQAAPSTDDSFFPSIFDQSNNFYPSYQTASAEPQIDMHNFSSSSNNMDPSMCSHFDWENFASSGFTSSTAPPTPDNFLPIQQPEPSFQAEEAIPYHSLDDSEPGEVLVGMGLYDAPEKVPESDPQLDKYRALMMSQLLGSAYKKPEAPSTGKGLKLEETWIPPASDDGEAEDEDEEDAEGSEAEEEAEEAPVPCTTSSTVNNTVMYNNLSFFDTGAQGQQYGSNAWV